MIPYLGLPRNNQNIKTQSSTISKKSAYIADNDLLS